MKNNTAAKINQDYKLNKKLELEKKKHKEKIEKQYQRIINSRENTIKKAKEKIDNKYDNQYKRYLRKQEKILKRKERKLLGKKQLKSLETKRSFAKRFDDLLYFIQRFCKLRDTDINGYGNCITCGKRIFWKEGVGGHAITRKQKKSAYLEECINLQCNYCNGHLAGNYGEYRIALDKKYGEGTYERLKSMKGPIKVSDEWIEQQKMKYKAKIKQLLDNKSDICKSKM